MILPDRLVQALAGFSSNEQAAFKIMAGCELLITFRYKMKSGKRRKIF